MSRPGLLAALFAGAAAISAFTILRPAAPFDEGIVLQAARRVADGQIPYRDFDWAYGPLQPYLLGGAFEALGGPSLLVWRILRVLCDAGVATLVYVLVRREAPHRLALVAWLATACAMAQPTSATPSAPALLFALLALAAVTRDPPVARAVPIAALFVAIAAAWRIDFAVYAGGAVVVVLALRDEALRGRLRSVATFGVTAIALSLLAYLPLLIAVGPLDAYGAVIGDSLGERDYWTLPFPLGYEGGLSPWPPDALAGDARDALRFYVPLLLVLGGLVAALATAFELRRADSGRRAARLGILTLAAGCLAYLLSRVDELHAAPLLVVLAVALPVLAWRLRDAGRARWLALAAAAILALLTANGVADRAAALLSPPELATIDLPAADGAKAPPEEAAALERMARTVGQVTDPDEPIYAVTARSDLVRVNQPLIYVLSERDNPTPIDYGLQTSAAEQERLIAQLRRAQPAVVVRWHDPASTVREPNLRGRPSGSRLLDAWIAGSYRSHARFGDYEILLPTLSSRGRGAQPDR